MAVSKQVIVARLFRYRRIPAPGEPRLYRNDTPEMKVIAHFLHSIGFHREYTVPSNYRAGLPWRLDFAHPRRMINVEIDDTGHDTPVALARDARRDAALRNRGWVVYRLSTEDFCNG